MWQAVPDLAAELQVQQEPVGPQAGRNNISQDLILKLVSQRFLATGTINKSVRIPRSVTKIICMVIEFIVAVLTSAVECRIVLHISCNGIRIYNTAVLNPGSSFGQRS